MEVQVFGVRKSAATRAALRFFAERRVKTPSSISSSARRRSASCADFLDRESRRYAELGRPVATLERLSFEPLLLRMPLVRNQQQLTVGPAEETWKEWMK